jgi:hypothetical protein
VQHKGSKVRSLKERTKLVYVERGCLLIAITCMNAVSTYISPMMKWSMKNMKAPLMYGAVIRFCHCLALCFRVGRNGHFSPIWFDHSVKYVKPLPQEPVQLLPGQCAHPNRSYWKGKKKIISKLCACHLIDHIVSKGWMQGSCLPSRCITCRKQRHDLLIIQTIVTPHVVSKVFGLISHHNGNIHKYILDKMF